jgi:hypothetical protein
MKHCQVVSLQKHIEHLRHCAGPSERALAADEIGDLLQRTLAHLTSAKVEQLREAIVEIMSLALKETDCATRESLLHALVNASSLACAKGEFFDPSPIASALDGFTEGELEYALYILAFSRCVNYRSIIERYLNHPSSNIRDIARQALQEMEYKRKPG